MLNDSTDNRLPERLNILIFTYLNFNLVLSIACPMSLLSLEQYCPAGFFHCATVAQNYRQIFTDYKMFIVYEIIVKKLNSLKHLVRTTVAESHN